ncbi:MAG: ECF transporter S component [Candidatus Methanomethylicia archaeon]
MKSKHKTVRIARIAIFTSLAVIGSFIKIPSPTGTVALDSLPGYFSILAFGYIEGVVIAALGHIATSMNAGFPLGFLHILIALFMMGATSLLKLSYDYLPKGLVIGTIIAATFNGLGGFLFSPFFGLGLAVALTPSLMVASYVNVILASIIFQSIKRRLGNV